MNLEIGTLTKIKKAIPYANCDMEAPLYKVGAGERARTVDLYLGKVSL